MKKYFFFSFCLFALGMNGQEAALRMRGEELAITADQYFGFNNSAMRYFSVNNNFVSQSASERKEYQESSLGKITRADVQNPLLIMLFYESFNTIVLLDNQLNEINRIDFSRRHDNIVVQASGLAAQNQLWIFDGLTQQLMLYDYQRGTTRQIGVPILGGISYYETDLNNFFWIDSDRNAFSMDVFGKIQSLGRIPEHDLIRKASNGWLVARNGEISYFDPSKNSLLKVADYGNSLKNFYFKEQILSIFTSRGIAEYNLKLP